MLILLILIQPHHLPLWLGKNSLVYHINLNNKASFFIEMFYLIHKVTVYFILLSLKVFSFYFFQVALPSTPPRPCPALQPRVSHGSFSLSFTPSSISFLLRAVYLGRWFLFPRAGGKALVPTSKVVALPLTCRLLKGRPNFYLSRRRN